MLIRLVFFLSFLLVAYKASAQRDSLSTKYREDQFYISFGLQLQKENINGFKQNGFSNNFQVGFVRDIPLNDDGGIAIGLGVGYAYNRLISNLNLVSEDNHLIFSIKDNDENSQTYSSLVIPLSFRVRTSTPDRTDFWRVYGGMKYMFNFGENYRPFYGKSFQSDFIKNTNTVVFLSMGFNTWNIYFEYDINSIYQSEVKFLDGKYPHIQTIKLGLIFYIL
tara:strand:+ start:1733 stop:2395 length:663 start_codon:yes stop_codon:yes gene_type:complete